MIVRCQECKREFTRPNEDSSYKHKVIWCDDCVEKYFKKLTINKGL